MCNANCRDKFTEHLIESKMLHSTFWKRTNFCSIVIQQILKSYGLVEILVPLSSSQTVCLIRPLTNQRTQGSVAHISNVALRLLIYKVTDISKLIFCFDLYFLQDQFKCINFWKYFFQTYLDVSPVAFQVRKSGKSKKWPALFQVSGKF